MAEKLPKTAKKCNFRKENEGKCNIPETINSLYF
jgi:hypothetical protein